MTKKIILTAKDEKQAIVNASKQMKVDESKLKAKLVKEGRKILFGIFKDLSEYEVSYEVVDGDQKPNMFASNREKEKGKCFKEAGYDSENKYRNIDDIPDEDMRKKAKKACGYLDSILSLLNVGEINKEIEFGGKNTLGIKLSGEKIAVVVGRFGEVLDAIQYLVVLCANSDGGRYMKVMLDSGDFRKNRKKTLQQLSKKIANKAIINKKTVSLEPMNPYERRIVHSYISKLDGVYSKSMGVDPHRRVVVYPEGWSGENLDLRKPNRRNRKSRDGGKMGQQRNYKLSTYDFEKEFLKSVEKEKEENFGKINLK